MMTLAEVLVSNYNNNYGFIVQQQIDEQILTQWCSLVANLYKHTRSIHNNTAWQRASELNDLPQNGELFDVVADILDMIGLVNNYPLRRSSDMAIRFVAYISAPIKNDEVEIVGQKNKRLLFRLRVERYFARLIIEQSLKSIQLLEDENEDLRYIRRVKTKRNKRAKEAALAKIQNDPTAVDDEIVSEVDRSETVELLDLHVHKVQDQMPIHYLTRKDLLWVYMGEDSCKDEKHHLMDIYANIEFYNGASHQIVIRRCAHCKQYQIDFEELEHIWKEYGLPKLEIIYIGIDGNIDGNYWKDRSVFSEHGYSVSQERGLTTAQRQQKLKWIIDHGVKSKYETIRFLRSRISINGSKPENWLARSKWKEDLQYVQSL